MSGHTPGPWHYSLISPAPDLLIERDALRAEVARLTAERDAARADAETAVRYWTDIAQNEARQAAEARAALRDVAERQREACEEVVAVYGNGEHWSEVLRLVAATPLVTEETPPASSEPRARTYPCDKCGKLRTKDEGGTVFTVCDACWDAAAVRGVK